MVIFVLSGFGDMMVCGPHKSCKMPFVPFYLVVLFKPVSRKEEKLKITITEKCVLIGLEPVLKIVRVVFSVP